MVLAASITKLIELATKYLDTTNGTAITNTTSNAAPTARVWECETECSCMSGLRKSRQWE